jgi:glutathione synthase/RimK-type ligase-like ATP-grasp enzyme
MSKEIIILKDYLGRFGSKQKSKKYRSGKDILLIKEIFEQKGYRVFIYPLVNAIEKIKNHPNPFILYTSSEDSGLRYKSFIEDIVFHLEKTGNKPIPGYELLKAHENKNAMELIRKRYNLDQHNFFNTNVFGAYEELLQFIDDNQIEFPLVLKKSTGALSRNVVLVNTVAELKKNAKKLFKKESLKLWLREYLRRIKHNSNYSGESLLRDKIILQKFVSGIFHDYKVLVYGNKCFVLKRNNRPNDFRASGSGLFEYQKDISHELLEEAYQTRKILKSPQLSIDIAEKDEKRYVFEFQALYFGTKTIEFAPFYFQRNEESNWKLIEHSVHLEKEFVESTIYFIENEC